MPHKSERIHLHGADKSDYFFLSDSIQWVESAKGGKHSVVHTPDEAVETRTPISALARDYGHLFLRCHASYLINPNYIRSIRRFCVTMTDGAELPIPERKYTAFRRLVDERVCTGTRDTRTGHRSHHALLISQVAVIFWCRAPPKPQYSTPVDNALLKR